MPDSILHTSSIACKNVTTASFASWRVEFLQGIETVTEPQSQKISSTPSSLPLKLIKFLISADDSTCLVNNLVLSDGKMGSFPVIGAHSAAYLSALGLIIIQVCIGIILKSSQTDGSYAFSVSGSVTISEFFKCVLSAGFVMRECLKKRGGQGRGHSLLPSSPREVEEELFCVEEEESGVEEKFTSKEREESEFESYRGSSVWRLFWLRIGEVSVDSQFGFALLALLYALINNSVSILIVE